MALNLAVSAFNIFSQLHRLHNNRGSLKLKREHCTRETGVHLPAMFFPTTRGHWKWHTGPLIKSGLQPIGEIRFPFTRRMIPVHSIHPSIQQAGRSAIHFAVRVNQRQVDANCQPSDGVEAAAPLILHVDSHETRPSSRHKQRKRETIERDSSDARGFSEHSEGSACPPAPVCFARRAVK